MGLLLLGGTVLLFALVIKKATQPDGQAAHACAGGTVDLRGRGMVMESQLEKNTLRLTLEKNPGHTEYLTVDACSGAVTGTLVIESDASIPLE